MSQMAFSALRLGLRANWQQFTLLIIVNAFVGAMVGLERTVLPLIAEADFGLAAKSVILSFLISFGLVKAMANLFAGRLSDRLGRKRILVAGWLVGLPVPLIIMFGPSWGWVVFANVPLAEPVEPIEGWHDMAHLPDPNQPGRMVPPDQPQPNADVPIAEYDFGTIPSGPGNVSQVYYIQNTGAEPLEIRF